MNGIELRRWEGDEFIITINGNLIGSSVAKQRGESIKEWLEIAIPEINKRMVKAIDNVQFLHRGDKEHLLRELWLK